MSFELIVEREGELVGLCAPEVGLYTCASPRGTALAPGQRAGVLRNLRGEFELLVPPGVQGVVTSDRPGLVLAPVGYRDLLLEVRPLTGDEEGDPVQDDDEAAGLVLRAQGSGRYYHRPAPDEPAFVTPGDLLEEGTVVGLIEVMKTFTHVTYQALRGLPRRARVQRPLVEDGADVVVGTPLLEIEEA